jgi:hypothetical protein
MYHVASINYVPNDAPQTNTKECASYICRHIPSVYINHIPTSQICAYNNHDIYQTKYKCIITSLNHVANMYLNHVPQACGNIHKPCTMRYHQTCSISLMILFKHIPYNKPYAKYPGCASRHIPKLTKIPNSCLKNAP